MNKKEKFNSLMIKNNQNYKLKLKFVNQKKD